MLEKRKNWFDRIAERWGKGTARASSKHERGMTKPHGWRRKLRDRRKRQKLARRAQH